jgi:hypothetical protein
MGAWGIGISSNDTYADVYERFFDLYNDGHSVSETSSKLISENQETIEIFEDAPNFWYALAKAQWECKELAQEVLARVEHYIQTGEDLEIWRELGATPSDLKSRQRALSKFLTTLRSEKASARKRKKKKYYDSIFQKGDCLVYKMDNGNYGGAFVLTEEKSTLVGINYIAITTIDKSAKPVLEDFETGEVYIRRAEEYSFRGTEFSKKWVDQPQIGGFDAMSFPKRDVEIEVIGNLPVQRQYQPSRIVAYGWSALRIILPVRQQYESLNGKPKSTLRLNIWIKKRGIFGFLK